VYYGIHTGIIFNERTKTEWSGVQKIGGRFIEDRTGKKIEITFNILCDAEVLISDPVIMMTAEIVIMNKEAVAADSAISLTGEPSERPQKIFSSRKQDL
jgi:hypothetical protein